LHSLSNSQQKPENVFLVRRKIRDSTREEYRSRREGESGNNSVTTKTNTDPELNFRDLLQTEKREGEGYNRRKGEE